MEVMTNDYVGLIKALEAFDTPTVSNAVATYPQDSNCLGLYDPHQIMWYTDERMKCLYPEHGPRCGFAVTCSYGLPGTAYGRLSFVDILKAVKEMNAPVILAMKQNMPEKYRRRNAMIGDNMMTALKQAGIVGVLGDGPARDVNEMRSMQVQAMFTGTTAAHGFVAVEAVNTPISLCSMDVSPGDIVHMDQNGAIKFPSKYLPDVLERVQKIRAADEKRQAHLRNTTDAHTLGNYMRGIYD